MAAPRAAAEAPSYLQAAVRESHTLCALDAVLNQDRSGPRHAAPRPCQAALAAGKTTSLESAQCVRDECYSIKDNTTYRFQAVGETTIPLTHNGGV